MRTRWQISFVHTVNVLIMQHSHAFVWTTGI